MKSEIWTFSSGSVWFSSFDIANPSLTSFPQRADGGGGVVGAAILVFGEEAPALLALALGTVSTRGVAGDFQAALAAEPDRALKVVGVPYPLEIMTAEHLRDTVGLIEVQHGSSSRRTPRNQWRR